MKNATLDLVHAWTAVSCFSVAVVGVGLMLVSLAFPARSTVADRTFGAGLVSAIIAVVVYVAYLIGTAVTLLVMLS